MSSRIAEGRAVVNDGDTLTLGGERIRLRGIDAPEFDQTCLANKVAYPCGRRARAALVALIGRDRVHCKGWENDRYGRLLGTCTAGDRQLNMALVEAGWAVAYGDYAKEERAARHRRVGLWAGTFDAPRDWRVQHGGVSESQHAPRRLFAWLRTMLGL